MINNPGLASPYPLHVKCEKHTIHVMDMATDGEDHVKVATILDARTFVMLFRASMSDFTHTLYTTQHKELSWGPCPFGTIVGLETYNMSLLLLLLLLLYFFFF